MTKLRSDSTLAQLTEDQRITLYEWIEEHSYDEAVNLAARPAPDGFGLKFHKTTLHRWFRNQSKSRHLLELAEKAADAPTDSPDAIANADAETADLTRLMAAARAEYIHATYELALAAEDPENYDRLAKAMQHRDSIQIKREELSLARDRLLENRRQFNFNAARAAMKHAVDFKLIANDDSLDAEDKLWAANDLCFGTSLQNPHPNPTACTRPSATEKHAASHYAPTPPINNDGFSPVQSPIHTGATPVHTGSHYDAASHDTSPGIRIPQSEFRNDPSAPPCPSLSPVQNVVHTRPAEKHADSHYGSSTPSHLASRSEAEIPTRRESLPPDPIHAADSEKHAGSHSADSGLSELIAHHASLATASPVHTAAAPVHTDSHYDPASASVPQPHSSPIANRSLLPRRAVHTNGASVHTGSHYSGSLPSELSTQHTALRTRPSEDLLSLTATEWLDAVEDPEALRRYFMMTLCNGVTDKFHDLMASNHAIPAYRLNYPKLKS